MKNVLRIGVTILLGSILLIEQSIFGLAKNNDLQKARQERVNIQGKMIEKSNRAKELQQKMKTCEEKVNAIQKKVEPLEREYTKTLDKLKEVDVIFKKRFRMMYEKAPPLPTSLANDNTFRSGHK